MIATEEIARIFREAGTNLAQADLDQIQVLLAMLPPSRSIEVEGTVWEAASLIINDPLYQGDARLPDVAQD